LNNDSTSTAEANKIIPTAKTKRSEKHHIFEIKFKNKYIHFSFLNRILPSAPLTTVTPAISELIKKTVAKRTKPDQPTTDLANNASETNLSTSIYFQPSINKQRPQLITKATYDPIPSPSSKFLSNEDSTAIVRRFQNTEKPMAKSPFCEVLTKMKSIANSYYKKLSPVTTKNYDVTHTKHQTLLFFAHDNVRFKFHGSGASEQEAQLNANLKALKYLLGVTDFFDKEQLGLIPVSMILGEVKFIQVTHFAIAAKVARGQKTSADAQDSEKGGGYESVLKFTMNQRRYQFHGAGESEREAKAQLDLKIFRFLLGLPGCFNEDTMLLICNFLKPYAGVAK
jgi:hypothetical protein